MDPALWKVKREEYEMFARDNNFILFEASASQGTNVNDMFVALANSILVNCRSELAVLKTDQQKDNIVLFDVPSERIKKDKSSGCC